MLSSHTIQQQGMELYPRIFGWDVKMFTNCRTVRQLQVNSGSHYFVGSSTRVADTNDLLLFQNYDTHEHNTYTGHDVLGCRYHLLLL